MDNKKSYNLLLYKSIPMFFLISMLINMSDLRAQVLPINNKSIPYNQKSEILNTKIDSFQNINKALKDEIELLNKENLSNELTIENRNFLIFSIFIFSCLALFLTFRLYISIKKAKLINKILKLQNLEIAQQKKELEELNQLKIKFFSIISHDIRSPLQSLKGVLNLYDANLLNDKAETAEFFTQLKTEFNSTSHLLDNLLVWAKKQMYLESIEKVGFAISSIINENINLQQAKINKWNISVFNLLTDDIIVYADKEMINMVVRNLLANSLKFTHFGGEISIFYKMYNNTLEIGIRDTGIGMSPEQIADILNNSFYSTIGLNSEKGNGLGLMLCREFLERSGGKLWIESKVGAGSTFFFTLPLFKDANENLSRTKREIPTRIEFVI